VKIPKDLQYVIFGHMLPISVARSYYSVTHNVEKWPGKFHEYRCNILEIVFCCEHEM